MFYQDALTPCYLYLYMAYQGNSQPIHRQLFYLSPSVQESQLLTYVHHKPLTVKLTDVLCKTLIVLRLEK